MPIDLQKLISAYQPQEEALQQLSSVEFVAIIGPIGAGKTTLLRYAVANDLDVHAVISDTDRMPRPGERDGVDYYFRTTREMTQDLEQGRFVQVALGAVQELKGTRATSYSPTGQNVMAVYAHALPVFRALPFHRLRTVYVIPPDYETWQERIDGRQPTVHERQQRLHEAYSSLCSTASDQQTTLFINADLSVSREVFLGLLKEKPLYGQQKQLQASAKHVLSQLLKRLEAEGFSR